MTLESKDKLLTIRMTETEKKFVKELAKGKGLDTSKYIMSLIYKDSRGE